MEVKNPNEIIMGAVIECAVDYANNKGIDTPTQAHAAYQYLGQEPLSIIAEDLVKKLALDGYYLAKMEEIKDE